jgi:hypothetical protein
VKIYTLSEFMRTEFPPEPWTSDHANLAKVVRRSFPKSHQDYIRTICWRYLDRYRMPLKEAKRCVRLGYSSPSAAMLDRITEDLR